MKSISQAHRSHAAPQFAYDQVEHPPRQVHAVVLATKKRWWPTRETRLARALSKAGHHVMLLPIVR